MVPNFCPLCESFNGGSAGGDGHGTTPDATFGHGTREDVTSYHFENWKVTPGDGGLGLYDGDDTVWGGGGGGVLVNGEGPERGTFLCIGEGYGGGGCYGGSIPSGCPDPTVCSLPGVILLEVGQ